MMKLQGRMTHTEINSIIFSNRQVTECEKFYMTEALLYSERDHSFSYLLEKFFLLLILTMHKTPHVLHNSEVSTGCS